MPTSMKRYQIRAVERALDVLHSLSVSGPLLTLNELSSRLDLSASTVYRLLVTLESRGYVEHGRDTGGYRLGVACAGLGTAFLSQLDLQERVLSALQALRDECKETVNLAILDKSRMEVIHLDILEGLLPIGRMSSRVAGREPAHCTSLGKCLLAHVSENHVRDFYGANELRAYTTNTITDLQELLRELKKVRLGGYAIDNMEHELDVKCVAAPVRNHEDVVIAAISVSGPEQRIDRLIAEGGLVEKVKDTAHEASGRMGSLHGTVREASLGAPRS